jgi:hypothetical protein
MAALRGGQKERATKTAKHDGRQIVPPSKQGGREVQYSHKLNLTTGRSA